MGKKSNNSNVLNFDKSLSKDTKFFSDKEKLEADNIIKMMLKTLKIKDEYTYGHSIRVAYFSVVTGNEMRLSADEMYNLELAALFHDLGKIGVPNQVLNKPSRLEEDEFLVMKKHPEMSSTILEDIPLFKDIALYAKHHHERYDGRGYPSKLKGEDIPLASRIILIADTFDAMTSTRPYRKGLPYQVAYDELKEFSGSQFDPNVVEHFINAMKREELTNAETFNLSLISGDFLKDAA